MHTRENLDSCSSLKNQIWFQKCFNPIMGKEAFDTHCENRVMLSCAQQKQICGTKVFRKIFGKRPPVIFLPLRQKLLKTLQNEVIFPVITKKALIYPSNLWSQLLYLETQCQITLFHKDFNRFVYHMFQLFLDEHKVSDNEEKCLLVLNISIISDISNFNICD